MSAPFMQGTDTPTGVIRDHAILGEVFMQSAYQAKLFSLADKRKVASGNSVTIPSILELDQPTSLVLAEDQPIPLSKLSITSKAINVSERGRGISVTHLAQSRIPSPIDLLNSCKEQLAQLISRDLEKVCATALKTTQLKYVPTGVASQTITTNGTAGAAALANINVYHLRYLSNYMQDDLRIPMNKQFNGYVGVFRGNGLLSVQLDPEFTQIHQGLPDAFASLKVGRIADVVLFPINDSNVLDNAIGTNNDVSEGILMGDQAVVFGIIDEFKVAYDLSESKATDFGRFKYVAYRGDFGAGLYNDSANAGLVRSIHVTSNV